MTQETIVYLYYSYEFYRSYPMVNSQFAIDNGPVEIVDLPMKHGGSFHGCVRSMIFNDEAKSSVVMFVYQRVNWGKNRIQLAFDINQMNIGDVV